MIRRWSPLHLAVAAAVGLVALLATGGVRADPVPFLAAPYDPLALAMVNRFWHLVSATVPCAQWVGYWAPAGTFYHPAFAVASGAAALQTFCEGVRASMNGPTSVFAQIGAAYQTTTTTPAAAGGAAQPITHLLVPYHFATSPAPGTNASDVFLNTGFEYLQLVPNPSPATAGAPAAAQPYPYLFLQATEFFGRREVAYNWTDGEVGAAPGTLQALLNTLHRGLDTTLPCSGWANGVWAASGASYYTTDLSQPLTNVPLDFADYCTRMRASAVAGRTAERQNGAYLTHTTSDGSVHALVPYAATLYAAVAPQPPATAMNMRIGYRALLLAAPATPGAGYRVVRATQFSAPLTVPWPSPAPCNTPGGDDGSGHKGLAVGWVVALVAVWSVATALITACVCRWMAARDARTAGTHGVQVGAAYARMAAA